MTYAESIACFLVRHDGSSALAAHKWREVERIASGFTHANDWACDLYSGVCDHREAMRVASLEALYG